MQEKKAGFFHRILTGWFGEQSFPDPPHFDGPQFEYDLFSVEQREQHGKRLAKLHRVQLGHSRDRLLARLDENERVLLNAHRLLLDDVETDRPIPPAGEWLLDNFYVIEEQIRMARRHLPKKYSRELPLLTNTPLAGLPRVYDIAQAAISHGDGRVDAELLGDLVAAYQTETALQLGELWAIPIMLRLALLENIRRIAAIIVSKRKERLEADRWADRIVQVATDNPKDLILVVADMARSNPPLSSTFVSELSRRLRDLGPAFALPLTWVEQQLTENNQTTEQLVRTETQWQLGDQVAMGNCIGSLRTLDAMDWRDFVERMSLVEQELARDPAGVFAKMDFYSRDRYRHVVEESAKHSDLTETELARQIVQAAEEAATQYGKTDRRAHVGYYLVDAGLSQLEKQARVRVPVTTRLGRLCHRHAFPLYLGGILFLTLAVSLTLDWKLFTGEIAERRDGAVTLLIGILAASAILLATSHLAVAIVNWISSLWAKPDHRPRMDFAKGIPPQFRTLVAVPAMLTNKADIETLWKDLEVRYLANVGPNLHFALLTDFCDSDRETEPEDDELLRLARKKTNELNQRYRESGGDVFFLFHRSRKWNEQEKVWMGYERKRGKLVQLNRFLRGGARSAFSLIVGDTSSLNEIKYVITLDADTQLPRDEAAELVGAMAHPLNRPVFSPSRDRILFGYGILQPRVCSCLTGTPRSRYSRLFGGAVGIDPYTRASSDVYQDLFGEGSFIGKGIYEIDAFETMLADRFPENSILSHDLLESCYARSGLLSDAYLYEEFPQRYLSDVRRRHRWIRGDWQIARWLFPHPPTFQSKPRPSRLSWLSRWKIFDNLRRSLTQAAMLLVLLFGWFLATTPWFWTLALLGIVLLPMILATITGTLRKPEEITIRRHLVSVLREIPVDLAQTFFSLAVLPFEAWYTLDAVCRALWRITVSRKKLLQWQPSALTNRTIGNTLGAHVTTMIACPIAALAVFAGLLLLQPSSLAAAGPLLALWFFAPAIAWQMSREPAGHGESLSAEQRTYLRKIARKTWSFFEVYVNPSEHWLPPDNYQEHPVARIAQRTSPTNMGLSLLANLAACDFGYVTVGRFLERTGNTLETMASLERYQGHFFNWYDTQTLRPLPPRYISSVDSGNLVGHLMTLRAGLRELADGPLFSVRIFQGLSDTLALAEDAWLELYKDGGQADKKHSPFDSFRRCLTEAKTAGVHDLPGLKRSADSLGRAATELIESVRSLQLDPDAPFLFWLQCLKTQCEDLVGEQGRLFPWLGEESYRPGRYPLLDGMMSLGELAQLGQLPDVDEDVLRRRIGEAARTARARLAGIDLLIEQCTEFSKIEYEFLNDETRHLLAIGYNVDESRRDAGFYDLLASEARLTSFVGIAQGALPQENWFSLSRVLTEVGRRSILLSWSGSMFEYLMPMLVMPTYEDTLLEETVRAAVSAQIRYGKQRGVPWGISESGYYTFDARLNYQYRAFGVPGLGLTRGLASDLVIAPYASVMSVMVCPRETVHNLHRMSEDGFEGLHGFYEAVDYTPSRLPRGRTNAVVRSFMAHHQGMSFLALAYHLLDRPMQRRFTSDPQLESALLLLQEKIPETAVSYVHTLSHPELKKAADAQEMSIRHFNSPNTFRPEVQLLSNGDYHVMMTNSGSGYSQWKDLAVTRWREDATRDHWGTFCYLRDMDSGEFWSTTYQPSLKTPQSYGAVFTEGRAEFNSNYLQYDSRMDVVVSPEDNIELRRVRVTNRSERKRTVELTFYTEVVLSSAVADALHPSFNKLFVQTEILRDQNAILCNRRPRAEGEQSPFVLGMLTVHGIQPDSVSFETDRQEFLGRNRAYDSPKAMERDSLAGRDGSVLDPVMALRCRITLGPEQAVTVDFGIGIDESREAVLRILDKYREKYVADRVFDMASTHGHMLLHQLNATELDAQLYNRLAGSVLYANRALRASENVLLRNRRGQSGLWGYAISGDWPIVLLKIEDQANLDIVRQLLKAHEYWRLRGLTVDLVIWNEDQFGYRQDLNDRIMELVAAGSGAHLVDKPGGIFLRASDRIAEEDRILIQAVSRVILSDTRGTLADQIEGFRQKKLSIPNLTASRPGALDTALSELTPRKDLLFSNGLGGFTQDGREYIITTDRRHRTPAPWANVLANPYFGTVVSETGASNTWHENAHEFRLTPWENDPVLDASGEAYYLRDEETGLFWSPMPWPCGSETPYVTRHGFGYVVFEHEEQGLLTETTVYVATDAPVKFVSIKIRNRSGRNRRLSLTGFVRWVLGDLKSKTGMYVVTEIDPVTGAVFARNSYNMEFPDHTAFYDVDDQNRTVTCDSWEFIGRNGSLSRPAAMLRTKLSGRCGGGFDPCTAMKVDFNLDDGQERVVTFRLGCGVHSLDAETLVRRFRGAASNGALEEVWRHWSRTLGAVHVETPEPSFNVLANGWLLYQTLSCRFWGRNAIYQSGGAFGFRDQLQDSMALIYAHPELLRQHLLLCASHQFVEGDVMHWWHPPMNRGVRTLCSDDYLWLPLVTCRYVLASGDTGVLDEPVRYIEGRALRPGEESYYDLPLESKKTGTLYEHCVQSILHGLRFGKHGLPLMGSGDWNDGMDHVGREGKGESVWLGFFLYSVLVDFVEIARIHEDEDFAQRCLREAETLKRNLDKHAWDGQWYRRAYFDDGSPLGSSKNPECRIDSIAQSWSVLSGAGDPKRSATAMQSLYERLVRRDAGLIQLFDPPFDSWEKNPGYIKGYVPGVRENGGQYTHAAIWAIMAFAEQGDTTKAWELLNLINPVHHGNSAESIDIYKVEPYVMAADVYASPLHLGRGGWTWYTGSASWMYRLMLESILGLQLHRNCLTFRPRLPDGWDNATIHYRFYETIYHITLRRDDHVREPVLKLDGEVREKAELVLRDDRKEHLVEYLFSETGRGA